ncbi:MAG TPA: cephalosporin hydroxylase family protein [Candidatus Eremiobacteraceae bacterium]|nr:cephalosporin hydroxylase family protein [Candidatus Eremiobacteraceae bacterium]
MSETSGPYDPDTAHAMASDPAVTEATQEFFLRTYPHRYSYNFTWLGRPIIQYPQDIVALQEIIWRVRPDAIVETGIAHGGSTVLFASMLELLGGDGRVIAIDVDIRPHNRAAIERHPLAPRIDLIEGSSIDPVIAGRVAARTQGRSSVMVVLDSDHTHDHVRAELGLYAPLVTPESYLVVMDTVIEQLPPFADRSWGAGNNPMTAVREFLTTTDRFMVDTDIEQKLLITAAPSGYLRRVK